MNDLKEKTDTHILRWSGSEFHVSGPWCLMDLWARSNLGLYKWKSLEWRVGYVCILELEVKNIMKKWK